MLNRIFLSILFFSLTIHGFGQQAKPLRIGIAGLTHDHVNGLLARAYDGDIEIAGIAESNRELAEWYLKKYKLSFTLLYSSLEEYNKVKDSLYFLRYRSANSRLDSAIPAISISPSYALANNPFTWS